jgi:hypothetical protein
MYSNEKNIHENICYSFNSNIIFVYVQIAATSGGKNK